MTRQLTQTPTYRNSPLPTPPSWSRWTMAARKTYLESDQSTPLPYIAQDNAQTIKSLRTTDQVTFQHPVIVGYSHEQWRYQPTAPVTGNTAGSDLPITWEDSAKGTARTRRRRRIHHWCLQRIELLHLPWRGYGGSSYDDMDGNPVTVKRGTTRGAYTAEAFENQQRKIVAAVNGLDADVIALSEIEDGYGVTGDKSKRDQALAHLTDELNAAAGSEVGLRGLPGEAAGHRGRHPHRVHL